MRGFYWRAFSDLPIRFDQFEQLMIFQIGRRDA
jgi:hypothetical protein